jgi:hypothetical protein
MQTVKSELQVVELSIISEGALIRGAGFCQLLGPLTKRGCLRGPANRVEPEGWKQSWFPKCSVLIMYDGPSPK